jgi:hypothetical protein
VQLGFAFDAASGECTPSIQALVENCAAAGRVFDARLNDCIIDRERMITLTPAPAGSYKYRKESRTKRQNDYNWYMPALIIEGD